MNKELELIIPKSCIYNVGIGCKEGNKKQKYIFGDTNDSSNWDKFSIPLPEGDWEISKISEDYSKITIKKIGIEFKLIKILWKIGK